MSAKPTRATGILTGRPQPPSALCDPLRVPVAFEPAPEVWTWAAATFARRESPLFNPEHIHLNAADVGILWTNAPNSRQMRTVVGMAEMPGNVKGGKWQKARAEVQMDEWFACTPDFLITLDAVYCATLSDASFCALVEHEMYHCAQARTDFGAPRFKRDGRPLFAMRGHDAEEFVGIVRRYGVGAAAGGVGELVRAASRAPEVAAANIAAMCGTCQKVAA